MFIWAQTKKTFLLRSKQKQTHLSGWLTCFCYWLLYDNQRTSV